MMEMFHEALLRLSSSAKEQEEYLQRIGTAPSADELALEFSDALGVVQERLDEGLRDTAFLLDRYLEEMSGSEHAEIWTVDALYAAPEWARVRQLAYEVLRILGERAE